MAGSTYSTNLKLELMTTGENSGTWGDVTNTNLGTALEQAVVGYGNPDYVSDADLTISITNTNAAQPARALVLNVTSTFGSLTATRELVVPTIQKQYIVQNNTTGGQSITVKTSAGTGITVPNGRKAHLYVDGTDVIQMFDFVDINGGAIDGTAIGASSASTGAFTTLNASGATTLDGNVTLGNASGDTVTVTGTIASNLLFTDNTYDIGASGATRPRNLFLAGAATIGGNLSVGGTLTLTGGVNLNGNVTVGDSAADTLTINSTVTSNLIFTDNTYDIGASGATRPRNLFLAGNATVGGAQTLTGALTVDSTTDTSSATTGSIQTDGGVGIAKSLYVGGNTTLGDASTDTVTVNGYMGVGGAANASHSVNVASTALTGVSQRGVFCDVTGSSAAISDISGFYARVQTAAASFTTVNVFGYQARDAIKGAGSTITNQYGVFVVDQTQGTNNYGITSLVSSGTNKWNIYASGTAANYFAGNVGIGTNSIGTGVTTHISGTARISNSSGGALQLEDTTVADGSLPFWVLQSDEGVFRLLSSNRSGLGTTGSITRFSTSISESVFNDTGADIDFRVESDTNTHALFVDAGNSRVGVNNSAPAYALDVSSAAETAIRINSATGYDTVLRLAANGTNKWALFNEDATDDFVFYSNATTAERLRLTDTGNLGLGVTPSAWSSSWRAYGVAGGATLAGRSSNTEELYLSANVYNDGVGWKYIATNFATQYYQDAGTHVWRTAPSGTAGDAVTFTERLTVGTTEAVFNDPGGDYDFRVESDTNTHALFVDAGNSRVGVNNSAPAVDLDVSGDGWFTTSGSNSADTAFAQAMKGVTIRGQRSAGTGGFASLNFSGSGYAGNIANVVAVTTAIGTSYANSSGALVLATKITTDSVPVERARITNDSTPYLRLASGTGGIQFGGDTAAANALDDYEEGTWTPSATYTTPGTLSITYNEQYGYYTKVGRQVTVVGMVAINTFSKGTASGSLIISGLPFAMASLTRNQAHGSLSQYNAPTSTTDGAFPALGSVAGGSYLSVGYFNNSGLGLVVDPANGSQYFFTMTYFTS